MNEQPKTQAEAKSGRLLPEAPCSALLAAALACLRTNGGPIDGADTIDGHEYVMVRMESFKALEAAAKAPNSPECGTLDGAVGMSLRDWFAGQALVGLLSNANGNRELLEPEWAALAYQAADAMIKARSN